jgi:hypothetical protein
MVHLREVVQRLHAAGFTSNPAKCHIAKTEIEFLGQRVSGTTLRPGKEKLKAVADFPAPQSIKDVQSYLGLTNYFRQ